MASLVEQRFVEEVLTSEGARLLKNQEAAFVARLHFHSGNIVSRRQAEVSSGAEMSGKLVVTHMAYERYLDLKRLKYGKTEVRRNRRIHNRYIWGAFDSIAYRLANDLTDSVAARIRASLNTT
jgi:phage-related protein